MKWNMKGTQQGGLKQLDLLRLKEIAASEEECEKVVNRFMFWPERPKVYVDYTLDTRGNWNYKPKRVCNTARESFLTALRTLNFSNKD